MVQVAAPSFGARLRHYRREAGLTQEELAEQAGLSVRGISDLERDVKLRPHRDTVARLADALQLEGERRAALEAAARRSRQSPDGPAPNGDALLKATTDVHTVLIADVRGHPASILAHGDAAAARLASIAQEAKISDELPPLQPILVTHPNNLPDDPTPFIGREREINEIAAFLRSPSVRLVTLTGPGGTGKTRLALQVGNTFLYDFSDGVFFCDLAPLTDAALVPSVIVAVLGVKEQGERQLMDLLTEHLKEKHLLLLLDNVEHLLDACSVVASLLAACRDLHILVTSRIPLHLSREQEYPVPPLAVPDASQVHDAATLSQYESVALFIQRAGAVKPGFSITNENAPAVAEICTRLDGLPLAIELAAARVKLFPPQALLRRLDSRLKLLTGGARDRATRQQTLRGTIDWSYSLLDGGERALFAWLSIFAGGWSFEASEAVCNSGGELDFFEGMSSLVDKSLVRQEGEYEPRFSMLETIREYAAEKMVERGDADVLQEAHTRFYLDLVTRADGEQQDARLSRIDSELDNVRAALRWATTHDPETALRAAVDVAPYWESRVLYSEAVALLQDAVDHSESCSPLRRARALSGLAQFYRAIGNVERATALGGEGLDLARKSGDRETIVNALDGSADLAMFRGDTQRVSQLVEEGLTLTRNTASPKLANFLYVSSLLAVQSGDLEDARSMLEEVWMLRGKQPEANLAGYSLAGLAVLQGEAAYARARAEEHIALSQMLGGFISMEAHAREMLARALILEGDLAPVRDLLTASLTTFRDAETKICPAHSLEVFARLALAGGDPERAARLLAGSFAIQRFLGMTVYPVERLLRDSTVESTRAALDPSIFSRAWQQGESMSAARAVAFALEGVG